MTVLKHLNKHKPEVGDVVDPDGWRFPGRLSEGNEYVDKSFPGCQFRLHGENVKYAVNVKVTGGVHLRPYSQVIGELYLRSRCKIEFVKDGEESTFTGGWIYHGLQQQ